MLDRVTATDESSDWFASSEAPYGRRRTKGQSGAKPIQGGADAFGEWIAPNGCLRPNHRRSGSLVPLRPDGTVNAGVLTPLNASGPIHRPVRLGPET
jgi:hypothetical protein